MGKREHRRNLPEINDYSSVVGLWFKRILLPCFS
ncbi:hypothetical protein NC652_028494 [Populus alba x Populus x berolinensis]|nr:hypothetical protein NC652_028494 [Populus alba x Populus x berolinensis]